MQNPTQMGPVSFAVTGGVLLAGPASTDTTNWFPYPGYGDYIELKVGDGFFVQSRTTPQPPWPYVFAVNASTNPIGGTVSIGSATPQCPTSGLQDTCALTVKGAIVTGEILVLNTLGADYVFDENYRLAPLPEVAAYIREHHHLPEIPSAAEVKVKGVSLGDMQGKLLAKIEELTLHLIQAEEKNRELQERVARLEAGSH